MLYRGPLDSIGGVQIFTSVCEELCGVCRVSVGLSMGSVWYLWASLCVHGESVGVPWVL